VKRFSLLCLLAAIALEAATVILPENPTVCEKTAAKELATHLQKAYGTTVPVLPENAPGNQPPFLYVGDTKLAAQLGVKAAGFGDEEYLLRAVDAQRLLVAGGAPRGVLYAALECLGQLYGVLWMDDEFTHVPASRLASWPADFCLQGKPDFAIRCIHTYWSSNRLARQLCAIRNGQNLLHDQNIDDRLADYGMPRIYGSPRVCHTYYDYTKDWGKEDEVCFSMNEKGKRVRSTSAHGPGQICWSNPRTSELFAERLRRFIKEDQEKYGKPYPYLYEISDNDNGYRCHCPDCLALARKYQGYSGIVLDFTNRVARAIAKEYPYVIIQMMAYKDTYDVPQGIRPEPNVWIRLTLPRDTLRTFDHPNNAQAKAALEKWGEMKQLSLWDWWVLYYNTGMGLFHDPISDCIRRYKACGVQSLMVEMESPLITPFYALRLWLGRRFMLHADLNLDTETRRFMNAYYGPEAAPVMEKMLNYMRTRQDGEKGRMPTLAPQQRSDLDDAFFQTCYALIDKALPLVSSPMQGKHIRHERFALDYGNLNRNRVKVGVDPAVFDKRMHEDFALCAPLYMNPNTQKQFLHDLETTLAGLTAQIPPVQGLEDYNIHFDLAWPRLNGFRKSKMAEDADAAGGKAVRMEDFENFGGKLCLGFYNISDPKKSKNIALSGENIPQDEKYHLYPIGTVELGPKGYFWGHASWNIQVESNQYFNPAYNPSGINENEYELFISAKAEGPNYVKGSTKTSALSVDRIILARKKKVMPH